MRELVFLDKIMNADVYYYILLYIIYIFIIKDNYKKNKKIKIICNLSDFYFQQDNIPTHIAYKILQ